MKTVYQFGVAQAFLSGLYEADWRFDQIKGFGNFGHGTFNGVAGELIVLEGKFYRVDETGKVFVVEGEEKTPITTLVQFEPTHQEKCSATASFASLNEKLFKKFTQPKFIYAIKLEGVFSSLAIRSETPQPKPYQPMDKSFLPTQRKFHHENIQGTLVGFYIPDYFQRLLLP